MFRCTKFYKQKLKGGEKKSTTNKSVKSTNEWDTPVVSAQIGHYVFVLTLLHHGDLLLDGRDVIT